MKTTQMIYPMFAMFVLTFGLFVHLFRARAGAVARREIKMSHYQTYSDDQRESDSTLAIARHFSNLFETPVLFYTVCLAIMIADATNLLMVGVAWAYVASRVGHAVIHLGSNTLRWRIVAYFASWMFLAALWLALLLAI